MAAEVEALPVNAEDAMTTGSRTVDRVLNYSTVQKGKEKAEAIVSNSSVLSYISPAAQKSLSIATNVAQITSGYVPGAVKVPVINVAQRVDDFGEKTLQKLEDVTTLSQEKLHQYVKDTLPLDGDDEDQGLNVKERVVVNGKKAVEKVVPETVVSVAGKSVAATKTAAGAVSTAYNGLTKENIKGVYDKCTIDNAKQLGKDTVTGAYNQMTTENAKAVVKGTAGAAKTVTQASLNTTKAVVNTSISATQAGLGAAKTVTQASLNTTKAVVNTSISATQAGLGAAKTMTNATVKAVNYAMGSTSEEDETPSKETATE